MMNNPYLLRFRRKLTAQAARIAFVDLHRSGGGFPQDLLDYLANELEKQIKDYAAKHPRDIEMEMYYLDKSLFRRPSGMTKLEVFDGVADMFNIQGTEKNTPGELLRKRYDNFFKTK